MPLLVKRDYYKPFEYEWAFEAYKLQTENMHWLPSAIPLAKDVKDWNRKLTENEKHLLTQLFRFFTQADLDIASGYLDKFIPIFKVPEIRMMMTSFASMESIHQHAYSLLLDTVGMPELEYKAFKDFEVMTDKHKYMTQQKQSRWYFSGDPWCHPKEIALDLAIYSAFGEGMQLFSSFAILLNFPRHNKMNGMGQIVTYSIRDESLHVESMIKLFHTFLDEQKKIWKKDLKAEIYQAALDMVDLEDKFIDLAFELGDLEDLTKEEVKQYIRYIADRRLLQLGLKPKFKVKENPLPWLDWVLNGVEHANFFEIQATEYGNNAVIDTWNKVWEKFDNG